MADPTQSNGDKVSDNRIPISIDGYGLKGKVEIRPDGNIPEPKSLKELWSNVKSDLLRIACDFVGLPADLLRACRSVVRGVGSFPTAIARRIERGHAIADTQEDQRQMAALSEAPVRQALPAPVGGEEPAIVKPSMVVPREALGSQELRQFLEHQKSKGNHACIKELRGGMVAIIITRPEAGPGAEAAADDIDPDAA